MENSQSIQNNSQNAPDSRKKSVLIIDDDSDTLSLQRFVLETEGFKVFTAQKGEEALQILSEIQAPNLILLDMIMEEMNGLEFLILLQEQQPRIIQLVPVVIMTGMDRIPQCKAAGMIQKPADTKTYLQAVYHYIEKRHQLPYPH